MYDLDNLKMILLQGNMTLPEANTVDSYWTKLSSQLVPQKPALRSWSRNKQSNHYFTVSDVQTIMMLCNLAYKLGLWNCESTPELVIDPAPLFQLVKTMSMKKQLNFCKPRRINLDVEALVTTMYDTQDSKSQEALFVILSKELQHLTTSLPPLPPPSSPPPRTTTNKKLWSEQEEEYA
jgi:hypothetical protein